MKVLINRIAVVLTVALISACSTQEPAMVVSARPSRDFAKSPAGRIDISAVAKADKQWLLPARGALSSNGKTLAITGHPNSEVVAARDGEVVYSGNSLQGYGNLIVIKHDKNFSSVYAHNKKNMVKEGDKVSKGQCIALKGVQLHFEMRRQGDPVDPLPLLKKR